MARGPVSAHYRNGVRPPPANEATSIARPAFPAPYNGWNARGNLANMSPLEAIVMDNIFPGVQDVSLRRGSASYATGFTQNVRTLISYSGPASNKFFAAASNGIFDISTGGAIGGAVQSCTNGAFSYVNFANSGGNWLILVNGVDAALKYDGTTWTAAAITGVTPSSLCYVTAHQNRLWFVQNNSMNLWYLGTQSIEGAATQFPVGALFKKGGYIVAIGSWTVDSGTGKDDMFVIVTSNGEIAVYAGTDPSSIVSWSLIGVYTSYQPLGTRPLIDYGGDILYLSKVGLTPLTRITQSSFLNATDEVSYNIDGAFLSAAENYGTNFGWQMLTHRAQNMLIVNVPVSSDTLSYQYVMNTITKAWCRFVNWNAACWGNYNGNIYYGGGHSVVEAWTGVSDSGAPIVGSVAQAYSNLGMAGQKNITLVRPNIAFSQPFSVQAALDADFKTFGGQTDIHYTTSNGAAIWDSDLWNTGVWDGGSQILDPKWLSIPGELGYLHSLRVQLQSSQGSVSWTSTDYIARRAGLI